MSVTELKIMPDLARDEEAGGYFYPKEFQNKLYSFKDQYIYFKPSSYDSFPKMLFNIIIQDAVDKAIEEGRISLNTALTETEMNTDENEAFIRAIIDEKLDEYVNRISNMMDKFTDKINDKLDLSDLQVYRDEIQKQLDSYFKNSSNLPSSPQLKTIQDELVKLKNKIDEIEFNIDNMQSGVVQVQSTESDISCINENRVRQIITDELSVVHSNLPAVIESIIIQNSDRSVIEHPISGLAPAFRTSNISLELLISLKSAGYTVDEILLLRSKGII